jgi:hypothetical protein
LKIFLYKTQQINIWEESLKISIGCEFIITHESKNLSNKTISQILFISLRLINRCHLLLFYWSRRSLHSVKWVKECWENVVFSFHSARTCLKWFFEETRTMSKIQVRCIDVLLDQEYSESD